MFLGLCVCVCVMEEAERARHMHTHGTNDALIFFMQFSQITIENLPGVDDVVDEAAILLQDINISKEVREPLISYDGVRR